MLMATEGIPDHLIHFYGEEVAFAILKQVMDYRNFIRNVDFSTYPMPISHDLKILHHHYVVAAALLAGQKNIYYMARSGGEEAADFGEAWLKDYPQKDKIVKYFDGICLKFGLIDPVVPEPAPLAPTLSVNLPVNKQKQI